MSRERREGTEDDRRPSLPSDRAFVLQLEAGADPTAQRVGGRIEHLASGEAHRFVSWAEVEGFVAARLAEASAERDDEGR